MTSRDRSMIATALVVAAIVASWLLLVQPKRDQADKLGAQVKAAQTQLDSARSQLASAEAAKSSFASSYTTLVKLGEAVPSDDNVPSLIYQLQTAATASGVDFRALNLNGVGSGGATSAAPSPSSSSAAKSGTPSLPPGVTVGPAGFPVEPFTFTFRGDFFHLSVFFGRLQQFVVANNNSLSVSGRLMTLGAINLAPGPKGFPQITATVSATTYLVPAYQGLTGGATPTGPATSSTTQSVSRPGATAPAASTAVATPLR
jgi:hypothetical protein